MNKLLKAVLIAGVLAVGTLGTTPSAHADPYWNNHWGWYNNTYRPYYNNYYAPYYGGGYYSPAPYYGGYYGGYGYGPGVNVRVGHGNLNFGWW